MLHPTKNKVQFTIYIITMDTEQYHAKYPIGSRWLLPVTVTAHIEPPHDDYDPRPIKLAYKQDAGGLYPRCRDLPELIPAAEQTADPVPDIATPYPTLYTSEAEDTHLALRELGYYLDACHTLTNADRININEHLKNITETLDTLDTELQNARAEAQQYAAEPTPLEQADAHLLADLLDYAAHLRFTQPPHHKRTLALIERAVRVLQDFDK